MAIEQSELDEVVQILRNIANDLESCGVDEWENLDDCINATEGNFFNDCQQINKVF